MRERTESEKQAALHVAGQMARKVLASQGRINPNDIEVAPDRLRKLQRDKVAEFAESMRVSGLAQPIVVRPIRRDHYELVAGWHRLEAAKLLGWSSIRAEVRRLNKDQAKLLEIEENLIRAELTPAERAMHIKHHKRLYEKLYPQTKHGGDRKSAKARSSPQVADSFAKHIAKETGRSRQAVERDVARAEKVKVLDDIKHTSLDKGIELDALRKLPVDEQRQLAEQAKAGEKVSAKHQLAERAGEQVSARARVEEIRQQEQQQGLAENPVATTKPADGGDGRSSQTAFAAAEIVWLKERGFAVNGDEATVAGAMTLRIAKTQGADDSAVIHIALPNGEQLVMRESLAALRTTAPAAR